MDHWLVKGRLTLLPFAQCVLSACLAQLLFLLMCFDPFGNIYFPRLCRHEQTEISEARWLVFVLPVYVKRYCTAKCLFAIGCWAGSQCRPDQTSCLRSPGRSSPCYKYINWKIPQQQKIELWELLVLFCKTLCCFLLHYLSGRNDCCPSRRSNLYNLYNSIT